MTATFFEKPILNSPYEYPHQHWELDESGQPTNAIVPRRRFAEFITPIPKPRKQKKGQKEMVFDEGKGLSTEDQQYIKTASMINELRVHVDRWREIKNPAHWNVSPETARLLQHWRHHQFSDLRPFFCQIEAVEVAIWLTEVAPKVREGKRFLEHIKAANDGSNPGLNRIALKLATGAGKTTVMAMLIAWQTINAVRRPNSKNFTRGFLIVAPGITIRDRLRVLQPNDPDSYYKSRELVPSDLLPEIDRAKIVITNYHAFKLRETLEVASGTRRLLKGRTGDELQTLETEGQMIQRVMPELMGLKNIMVINDEAHHCYREKPASEEEEDLKGDEKQEAEKNREAARLWISGIEAVDRKLGVHTIADLSATPFFLRGSGYAEGTLFPWTMSDFSLMDAIECGIVKLPRVPVADNLPQGEMPIYRNLWENIRADMPKKGRGKAATLDPLKLPTKLQTALQALYGHYEKTLELWKEAGVAVDPCFIVVCNNTSTSKLVYDYISGFEREDESGTRTYTPGRLPLFRNADEFGNPWPRPYTLLIDSEQLDSGEGLDDAFREAAAEEIERFKSARRVRFGAGAADPTDEEVLREVMNTVGKRGELGESIRCVVSVAMLTEGWDTNTVTHVLGVRAFGTQLLCEQVIGRALRRQSYDVNEDTGLFNVEYADVLGIPFDFNAKPVVAPPQKPRETIHVKAISPERDKCEIRFPRVEGYRIEPGEERLVARFTDESRLVLTPELVGPSITRNEGIIGEGVDLTLKHMQEDMRQSTLLMHLTKHLLLTKWRDPFEEPKLYLFGQLKRIVREWLENYLECKGNTYPAQLTYLQLADLACEKIQHAINNAERGESRVTAILDPYNPAGSTRYVSFNTSKTTRWETNAERCHINWCILDSDWEAEFCRVVESHPRVRAYVKNHNLGFEVPYVFAGESRRYRPDFIVNVDDGHGDDDPLHLVIEIKGRVDEESKQKKSTMNTQWIPGVNNLGTYGRWAFAEFTDVWDMELDFEKKIESLFDEMIERATRESASNAATKEEATR